MEGMERTLCCDQQQMCCVHREPTEEWPETILIVREGDELAFLPLAQFVQRACALRVVWPRVIAIVTPEEAVEWLDQHTAPAPKFSPPAARKHEGSRRAGSGGGPFLDLGH